MTLFCIISEIKARCWLKIEIFSYPSAFYAPVRGPYRNIAITFGVEKLERWIYHTMNTV